MGDELYHASQQGDMGKVKSLVEHGAEINWIKDVSVKQAFILCHDATSMHMRIAIPTHQNTARTQILDSHVFHTVLAMHIAGVRVDTVNDGGQQRPRRHRAISPGTWGSDHPCE